MVSLGEPIDLPEAEGRRVVIAPPAPVRGTVRRRRGMPSENALAASPADRTRESAALDPRSPVTDIRRVLQVFAVGVLLAVIFGARGLVHSGYGMDDGPKRAITLAIAQPLLAVTEAFRLTLPWDGLSAALGRGAVQNSSPLLSSAKSAVPTAKPVAVLHFRTPTAAHPLRLLVTGDSLTEYIAPQLVDRASRAGPVRGFPDTHYGTGLVRPDFVDWSVVARQQVRADHPDAVVVFIGGNDFQNMTMPNGQILHASSPAWTREYQRRAEICMRIWTRGGKARVYWLSMPPARSSAWSHNNAQINLALQRAARHVAGAEFLNILGPVTNHGRYADFVKVNGQYTLVREPDGIHLNMEGSSIVADEVLSVLKRDWTLAAQRRRPASPSK